MEISRSLKLEEAIETLWNIATSERNSVEGVEEITRQEFNLLVHEAKKDAIKATATKIYEEDANRVMRTIRIRRENRSLGRNLIC